MGYTHYFDYEPTDPRFQRAWPQMVSDTRKIVARVHSAGIVLRNPFGAGPPVVSVDTAIALNGDETQDLSCEPLVLVPREDPPYRQYGFCKTGRFPYDLAVMAVLLRCHLLAPDAFTFHSDGRWDEDWQRPWYNGLSGRGVVADLFGSSPVASPFDNE
jgi:hypothetical protein